MRRTFKDPFPIQTIPRSRLKVVRKVDSSNTQPYVSSPFSLPPFDSLPPVPLPDNGPPFCGYPPLTPLPPSVTIPSPAGTPGGGGSSSPPVPIITIPAPSVIPGGGAPPAPFYLPPIPITTPPVIPTGPPGPSGTLPSPGVGPPYFTISPPTFTFPSPPTYIPAPGGGGIRQGPPVFKPPIVYPPPTDVPPPPKTGLGMALWCVAKPSVPDPIIQEAMNYACGSGADCSSLQPTGSCFQPDTLFAHASYAFNSYWQRTKIAGGTCSFGGTAILVTVDPSKFFFC